MICIISVYTLGALVSYALLVGWEFAYFQGRFSTIADMQRSDDAWFAYLHSLLGALLWPVCLPLGYFGMYDRAVYGWCWPRFK